MENPPRFDRELIVPIVLGFFSVFGICLVLLLGRLSASRGETPPEDTATPFQYVFLGTEPGISTTTPSSETPEEESDDETPERTPTALQLSTNDGTHLATTESASTETSATPSTSTPTSASAAPLNPGIYDQA